jgi:outer membrane protein TolC
MMRRSALVVLVLVTPARALAQDSTVSLSLAEALREARANSPAYRQALNDASPAKWGVRNAYGNLLPSVLASTDFGYTGSGQSNFGGGFTRPTSAFLTSGYSLGLQWQLSGRALQAPAQQRALQRYQRGHRRGWSRTDGGDIHPVSHHSAGGSAGGSGAAAGQKERGLPRLGTGEA